MAAASNESAAPSKLEELSLLAHEVLGNGSAGWACYERHAAAPVSGCPPYWDGVLCWPPTPPHTLAVMHCFDEFNGVKYDSSENATRHCGADGWDNYTDYSRCLERDAANITATTPADVSSLLYLAGYSLSLAALALAVFVFLYFKDLRCLRNTIHTNLMCTYILSGCIWILNLGLQMSAQGDHMSCMVLVVCLHYFYLTNFFWMLVEGLYLYMLVVETFTAENIKLKVYTTIGWGAPSVFIIIWVITRCFVTIDMTSPEAEELGVMVSERVPVCAWMREHPCDWLFKGPAMAGLAVNLLFLVRIMWVLITKLRSANTLETEQYRKATKALLVLIPLLGITYILVLCGPSDGWTGLMFYYARIILLSTQGFTVALFYCFLNTEVQHAIRHHVERWKTRRAVGGHRRHHCSYSKDWSPRSRTESIRLYSQPAYCKRESAASETTTTTLLGARASLAPPASLEPKFFQERGYVSGGESPV